MVRCAFFLFVYVVGPDNKDINFRRYRARGVHAIVQISFEYYDIHANPHARELHLITARDELPIAC